MSSGKFVDRVYVTDSGLGFSLKVQPETVTPFNANGAVALVAGNPSAQVSKGKRTIGVNARIARFRWAAAAPDGYDPNGIITLPIFTKTAFDALKKGVDYPYLGTGLNLVGKTNEVIR